MYCAGVSIFLQRFDSPGPLKTIALHLFLIALLSGLLTYGVYAGVFKQMHSTLTSDPSQGRPFWPFMHHLLILCVFSQTPGFTKFAVTIFLILLGIQIIGAVRWNLKHKTDWKTKYEYLFGSGRGWIYSLTAVTFMAMFFYKAVFKLPLGYPRNQVFLLPVFVLCAVLAFDQLLSHCRQPVLKNGLAIVGILLMLSIAWQRKPLRYDTVGFQSASKPLLKQLTQIDPERTWAISYDPDINTIRAAFLYYRPYKYRFKMTRPQQSDVYICRYKKRPKGAMLSRDRYKEFRCAIIVTPNFPREKMIVEYNPE